MSRVFRFSVERDLMELWRKLESMGVYWISIPLFRCVDGDYIEVVVYDDEAELIPPCWLPFELRSILEEMAVAYREHVDWKKTIYEDYKLWIEHASRYWKVSEEERKRKVEEILRSLKPKIEEEARSLQKEFKLLSERWKKKIREIKSKKFY